LYHDRILALASEFWFDAFSSEIRQKLDATECAASGKEANQGSTFPVAW
jgi:hypothetical protein